jgi:voltage-gated potassium channel
MAAVDHPAVDHPVELHKLSVSVAYQIVMVIVSVYSLLALLAVEIHAVPAQVSNLLVIVDWGVCLIFFVDFLVSLYKAENRWRYFYTWGWLDLLSSMPAVPSLRYARITRVLRIIRVFRALKATRLVMTYLLRQKRQTAFVSAIAIAFSLIIFASVAILAFEPGMGGHIDTAADALWWAISTVSTVGYGDVVPVTFEGRLIAVLLMTGGVGVFATMSGIIASSLAVSSDDTTQTELKRLSAAVTELSAQVAALRKDARE